MNTGEALYRLITKNRSPRTEPATFAAAVAVIVKRTGSVAGAARLLDIPRRTLRGWIGGKKPRQDVTFVVQTAVGMERRARLTAGRERNLRARSELTITATQNDRTGERTIRLGPYLRDQAWDKIIDAYLSGASMLALQGALSKQITDDFYRALFSPNTESGGTAGGGGSSSTSTGAPSGGGGGGGGGDDEDWGELDDHLPPDDWDDEYADDDLAYEGFADGLDSDYALSGATAS